MKNSTRKIISFFFLLLGSFPLLLTLFFTIKKYEIRNRMKQKLEKQVLQTIVIPEKDVTWMDKHEIWVNEQMFDIRNVKYENGMYTFTGLYDEEETYMVKREKETKKKKKIDDTLLTQFFKCIQNSFFSNNAETYEPICFSDHNSSLAIAGPVTQFKEILTPPPRLAC